MANIGRCHVSGSRNDTNVDGTQVPVSLDLEFSVEPLVPDPGSTGAANLVFPADTDDVPNMLISKNINDMNFRAFDFETTLFVRDDATFLVDAYLWVHDFVRGAGPLSEHGVHLGDGIVDISSQLTSGGVQCITSYCPGGNLRYKRSWRSIVPAVNYLHAWTRIAARIASAIQG